LIVKRYSAEFANSTRGGGIPPPPGANRVKTKMRKNEAIDSHYREIRNKIIIQTLELIGATRVNSHEREENSFYHDKHSYGTKIKKTRN
jgi:hypothetical protein